MEYELVVNGKRHSVDVDPDTPLLWVLRDELGLVGTKFGCGVAQCGACTIHLNGLPARSCVMPISSIRDQPVTTIEGLEGPEAEAVKAAWVGVQVPQCGFCQSGQVMTAVSLLQHVPSPDDREIDRALTGNICRCATYHRIRGAVHEAAQRLAEET
ncbi:MAG: (2Fe-2S)-binding protein [Thermoanaerobaculia bacterium]|nr:(2Fe-2S)-binding protein [Thermoanaerobaculia bacterium]